MSRFLYLGMLTFCLACKPTHIILYSDRPDLHSQTSIKYEKSSRILGYGQAKMSKLSFPEKTTLVAHFNGKEVGRRIVRPRFGVASFILGLLSTTISGFPLGFFVFQYPKVVVIPLDYGYKDAWDNPDRFYGGTASDSFPSVWDLPPVLIKRK
jgi:hypothetical protein